MTLHSDANASAVEQLHVPWLSGWHGRTAIAVPRDSHGPSAFSPLLPFQSFNPSALIRLSFIRESILASKEHGSIAYVLEALLFIRLLSLL